MTYPSFMKPCRYYWTNINVKYYSYREIMKHGCPPPRPRIRIISLQHRLINYNRFMIYVVRWVSTSIQFTSVAVVPFDENDSMTTNSDDTTVVTVVIPYGYYHYNRDMMVHCPLMKHYVKDSRSGRGWISSNVNGVRNASYHPHLHSMHEYHKDWSNISYNAIKRIL